MKAISVSELNNQIKSIIDSHFEIVYVKGEVSKVTYHSSGHLYFTLKDENSSINCAMWRSNLAKMKFKLKVGDKVFVYGAVNVYTPRGEYKLIAQQITPSGIGELQLAFERLKEELSKLGYFDESRKKPLPKYPKKIALITSATGAAIEDMLRIAKKRWLLSKFYLFDTLVQGKEAALEIARTIEMADNYVFEDNTKFDLIIIARGGGSKEDLWAFNERVVADAIFRAKTPIISAIGHEIDYLISDFVADKRAATPSNAMEIALPDKNEILLMIDDMRDFFRHKTFEILQKKAKIYSHLKELFLANSPLNKLEEKNKEIRFLKEKFFILTSNLINSKEQTLINLKKHFIINSPENKITNFQKEIEETKKFFYNLAFKIISNKEKDLLNLKDLFLINNPSKREKKGIVEIVKNGKKIALEEIRVGDVFSIENTKTSIEVKALKRRDNV